MVLQRAKEPAIFLLVGVLTGWVAWGQGPEPYWLLSLLVLPLAWGKTASRGAASMLMAGYYLASTRGLPAGAVVFFGDDAPAWMGWAMWVGSCCLLASPFAALWTTERSARASRFLVAIVVSALPPLAVIGWVNPVTVAGAAFPGLGWVGLVLTCGVMYTLAVANIRWAKVLVVLAVGANGLAVLMPVALPVDWVGVDTHFSRLSGAGSDDAGQLLAGMRRVEWVQDFALTVPAHSVRVLPETVVGTFDGVADFALQDTEAALAARGSRVLVGAEIPLSDGKYKNVVMVLGAGRGENRVAVQGIPVPVSMWKPWATDGAVANIFGRDNLIEVGGVRAGVIVCYEQLLAYSILWTMLGMPDVLVAVSNIWWARNTSIPNIQRQTVDSFGRLFGVGVIVARNF